MRVTDGKSICGICSIRNSVVLCDGCSKPLCMECRKFEMWAYGCGHIDPKAFCHNCFDDIQVNPWGGKVE